MGEALIEGVALHSRPFPAPWDSGLEYPHCHTFIHHQLGYAACTVPTQPAACCAHADQT